MAVKRNTPEGNHTMLVQAEPQGGLTSYSLHEQLGEIDTSLGLKTVETTLHDFSKSIDVLDIKTKGPWVDVRAFGAVGDGVTDDTLAIQTALDTKLHVYVPYTTNGYLISSTLTIGGNVTCDGRLVAVSGFSTLAVDIPTPAYGVRLLIKNLDVRSTSLRTAGSVGIRNSAPSSVMDHCTAVGFDYGIEVWSYSVMLLNCNAHFCNTNLSACRPLANNEINDFKVFGGSYDSAAEYSCRIGDPRIASDVTAGNPHGVSVTFMGVTFDGASSTFDRIFALNIIGCYWEGPAGGKAIILGGAGTNYLKTVNIYGCYFVNVNYAIYCENYIAGLNVGPNYYGGGLKCALYTVGCENGGFSYESGSSTSGFAGPEVHTGYGAVALSQVLFSGISIDKDYLINGIQKAPDTTATDNWYANGKTVSGLTCVASAYGRFHNAVVTISGSQSGNAFTCNTITDALYFNGGDRVTGANGSAYVRSVNYDTGVVMVDEWGSGAVTLALDATYFVTVGSGSAAPTTGAYKVSDRIYNSSPSAGGYVGWVCTVAGTPGTWKEFGLIQP